MLIIELVSSNKTECTRKMKLFLIPSHVFREVCRLSVLSLTTCVFSLTSLWLNSGLSGFDSRKLNQKFLKHNHDTLSSLSSPTKACLPDLPSSGGILYAQKSS